MDTDAKSVYAAVSARHVKQPADKSLWIHVQYLRELLDDHTVDTIRWIDTQDMASDGLTKGSVDREALDQVMAGKYVYKQEALRWRAVLAANRRAPQSSLYTVPEGPL